jgi:hypothetical protein
MSKVAGWVKGFDTVPNLRATKIGFTLSPAMIEKGYYPACQGGVPRVPIRGEFWLPP